MMSRVIFSEHAYELFLDLELLLLLNLDLNLDLELLLNLEQPGLVHKH